MDPQQRLLLEVAWHALEDRPRGRGAGWIAHRSLARHLQQIDYGRRCTPPELIDVCISTGNAYSVAAGRLSYSFGPRGPSIAVDTACSSSLVALHLAVRVLRAL